MEHAQRTPAGRSGGALTFLLGRVAKAFTREEPCVVVEKVEHARPVHERELMHVTMRFLGDVPVDRIEDLTRALGVVATRRASFTVHLEGVGMFGSAKQPHVLWAGVRDDERASLLALANDIDVSIAPIVADVVGARDRPFAAHVTLGRAKPTLRDRAPAKVCHPERAMPLQMPIEELVLFDSAPSPLAYTPIWRGRLGARSHAAESALRSL